jgi:hypothetical protein
MKEKIPVPTILFEPSFIYDRVLKEFWICTHPKKNYPKRSEILACAKKMETYWNQKKRGVLEEMALISHLKWRRTEIPCFIVGAPKLASFNAISHPLTIPIQAYLDSSEVFLNCLIHELIHNLFIDNEDIYGRYWLEDYLDRKYSNESIDTKAHILVYALHIHVQNKWLDKKIDRVHTSNRHSYMRAWEIVQTQGYENIIREFVEYVEEKKRSNR